MCRHPKPVKKTCVCGQQTFYAVYLPNTNNVCNQKNDSSSKPSPKWVMFVQALTSQQH